MNRFWIRSMLIVAVLAYSAARTPLYAAPGDTKSKPAKSASKPVPKGYVPMKAGPGTKAFKASDRIAQSALPKKVDLRRHMTAVEDQGETSSCVANAVAGSYEYWIRRAMDVDYDVSRLFVYYNARWRNGDQNEDSGSIIQFAMEGLQEFGACSEKVWPFEKPLLLRKPDRDAYKEAAGVKIKEMQQVPLELKAWKQALASGYPIVFGCLLFDSFDQCNQRGGVVPMPSPQDVGRSSHSGHAMCAVGYSEKEQVFIVRNSWGDRWGDKGYCYMPYNYLMNPSFNGGDSWVFVPENPSIETDDIWFEDEEPVTDGGKGVDFVINPYDADDYATIRITWWEETAEEYEDEEPADYEQYVEWSEAEDWSDMEDFDTEEIIETWEEEHPDESSELDEGDDQADDEESEEAESEDEEEMEEEGDDAGDEEEAANDEESDEADAEDEEEMEEEDDDAGDEEEAADDEESDEADAEDEEEMEEEGDDAGDGEDAGDEGDGGGDEGDGGGDEGE